MSEQRATTREVAAHLRVSRGTVANLARRGVIPYIRVGRQLRFEMSEVLKAVRPPSQKGGSQQ